MIRIEYADGQTVSHSGGLEAAIACLEAAETYGTPARARVFEPYKGLPEGWRVLAFDEEKYVFEREP